MSKKKDALEALQLKLVETQVAAQRDGARICVVLEGRDGAGKDGLIKRVTEHLSVRWTRVVAFPKPSDREAGQWWFQRYVERLPTAGEWVIFNRSWYNRAGVEKVMGFSTPEQQERFLEDAPVFERMLAENGIRLVKLWLDIGKAEQKERLDDRREDPLKQLKVSDMDRFAQERWDAYTAARDEMLRRTDSDWAPWWCVLNDDKDAGRLAAMAHLVRELAPADLREDVDAPDPERLFRWTEHNVARLAR